MSREHWTPDAALLERFRTQREKRLSEERTQYPARNPIASDLHDCRRYMVLRQVAWQVRPPFPVSALETMENGNVAERAILDQLRREGWEVIREQEPFEILQPIEAGGPRRRVLAGKADAMFALGRETLPVDVKDTSSFTFEAIDGPEDLDRSLWTRKWRRQGVAYMLGTNAPRFGLIIGHRGERKMLLLHLDDHLEEGEWILATCTWTVGMVDQLEQAGVTVETVDAELNKRGVPYHGEFATCRGCWLRDRVCYPPDPAERKSAALRPDLEPLVAQYLAAKPVASTYEKLRKRIKEETEGSPITIAGEFVLEGEVKTRRMKAQPPRPEHVQEHWAFDVRRVGERHAAEAEEG